MADVYEQNLPQKTNLTTNDYVRVVGSDDVSYKQPLSDVAQKTIENYAGSTLAGSTQSVKGAIDGLKSSATADKAELNASINEVASDLASESSTRASQDTNLQAQINQLVAPTGTAPNPAEIENARIGADNVTYTTLGDAIRTQVSDLKSDLNETLFADGCPYIKELYINEAGRNAGVDKLHSVYTVAGSGGGYFLRFCNDAGNAFTGHTASTSTPNYRVTPIYSGMWDAEDVYGYVIFDWEKITGDLTPVVALNEKSYHLDFSPQISNELDVAPIVNDVEYPDYDLVPNTFNLISTDYDLNDVVDSANRFATTDAFFCKGKVRIDFDPSIVGIGLKLYVMSMQSGRNSQYAIFDVNINESSYTYALNDTIRVVVQNPNGIVPQYETVKNTTKVYTLSDGVYFDYLNNSIIGTKKIWCFGDSLTAGVITGTTTLTESYPYWLKKFMGNDNASVTNFGVPGDTAVNMLSVISSKTFYNNCDIAIIMIGTNGYMNGDATDPTTPLGAYYASINHIINSGKGTVKIVLINPPKSVRSGVPARWLDEMHYIEQTIAEHFNLDMIDLYNYLPFAPDNATYYSSDQTHLTAIGYYYVAYIVYQYLVTHMTAQQVGGNPTFDY